MIAKKITNSSDQPDFQVLANRGRRTWVGSEAALEAALANDELTEGTVADTYVEGSITNGTQRRTLAWSLAQSVTTINNTGGYTAPADGIIAGQGGLQSGHGVRRIYVNGVLVAGYGDDTGAVSYPIWIQVNKDDVVTCDGSQWGTFYFVPFEDSTVQNIFVVTPEYIRQQNILSDWETITPTGSGPYTYIAPYDGVIAFDNKQWTSTNNLGYVLVNGVGCSNFGQIYGGTTVPPHYTSMSVTVKKGDVVTASATPAWWDFKARWYKLRDYGDRT